LRLQGILDGWFGETKINATSIRNGEFLEWVQGWVNNLCKRGSFLVEGRKFPRKFKYELMVLAFLKCFVCLTSW
jgi:hypothetical protein